MHPGDAQECMEQGGKTTLHVHGTTTIQLPFHNVGGKRVVSPWHAANRYSVEMAAQDDAGAGPFTLHPGDEIAASRFNGVDADLDIAGGAQGTRQYLCQSLFISLPGDGVAADQRLEKKNGVVSVCFVPGFLTGVCCVLSEGLHGRLL